MFNYATKADLKNATSVDTPDFAKKIELANLESDVDKLDIGKLKNVPFNLSNLTSTVVKLGIGKSETTPVGLSKLNHVVKNEAVKKTEYDKLVTKVKVNNINTTDTTILAKIYETNFSVSVK